MVSAENDSRGSGIVWAFDLDGPIPELKPLLPAFFLRIGPKSLPGLVGEVPEETFEGFQIRLAKGRRCYTAWVQDRLAAYGWVSFEEEIVGELRLHLNLSPDEAYIWDCFTMPVFRRCRLYSALLAFTLKDLCSEKVNRVWIGTNSDNLPSQRGIARAGFQRVAGLSVARVLALRMVWVHGFPGVPESLVMEARRVFLNERDRIWLNAPSAAAAFLQT